MSFILSKSALILFIFTVAGIAAAVIMMPDRVEQPVDDRDSANHSETTTRPQLDIESND